MKNKKVLIITYWYPPLTTIASLRLGKFVKYLPEFGWEPIVVTVEPRSDRFTRKGRLPNEIRYGRVYRTQDWSFDNIIYSITPSLQTSRCSLTPPGKLQKIKSKLKKTFARF